ncbi:hypothetical protein H4R21_002248, partial [Coemansia helicoidea]
PTKSSSNVCTGDGLLVKVADDGTVGLAGVLNMVAAKRNVPADRCDQSGVVDYFTTLGNYISWLTQITPLKESDVVSIESFSYGAASAHDMDESSESASERGGLDHLESSHSGAAARHSTLIAAAAAITLAALGMSFA